MKTKLWSFPYRKDVVRAHYFNSTGEAYDETQCNDDIKFGDVLVIRREKVVGVADAWPIAVTKKAGNLHTLMCNEDFGTYQDGKLLLAALDAEAVAIELGYALNRFGVEKKNPAIKLKYVASDGFKKTGEFKTLARAQKFAQRYVGETPDLGSDYAVSADGFGVIRVVSGAQLAELFPALGGPVF